MYGMFTYIWAVFGVNVGKYSIHGASGIHVALIFIMHEVNQNVSKNFDVLRLSFEKLVDFPCLPVQTSIFGWWSWLAKTTISLVEFYLDILCGWITCQQFTSFCGRVVSTLLPIFSHTKSKSESSATIHRFSFCSSPRFAQSYPPHRPILLGETPMLFHILFQLCFLTEVDTCGSV